MRLSAPQASTKIQAPQLVYPVLRAVVNALVQALVLNVLMASTCSLLLQPAVQLALQGIFRTQASILVKAALLNVHRVSVPLLLIA